MLPERRRRLNRIDIVKWIVMREGAKGRRQVNEEVGEMMRHYAHG